LARKRLEKNSGISTLLVVGVVVAVILVAGVAAYVFMNQNPGPSQSPEPTSTPQVTNTPSQSAIATATPQPTLQETSATSSTPNPTSTPSGELSVSGANSLQYIISATSNGVSQGSYTYYGKNIGTNNFMLRIEKTETDGSQEIFIFNSQLQKDWTYIDNKWAEETGTYYQLRLNVWKTSWDGYVSALAGWSGLGEYSYTQGSKTVRISNISVNPSLADSLFEHGSTP
jgi:hypothetical protein